LREARLEGEQRAHRQGRIDAWQREGDALLGVEHLHVAQLEGRNPAARLHDDGTDADRRAQHAARACLDRRAPLFDVRQNQPVK
jgi:hypothetical protein